MMELFDKLRFGIGRHELEQLSHSNFHRLVGFYLKKENDLRLGETIFFEFLKSEHYRRERLYGKNYHKPIWG